MYCLIIFNFPRLSEQVLVSEAFLSAPSLSLHEACEHVLNECLVPDEEIWKQVEKKQKLMWIDLLNIGVKKNPSQW